MRSETLRKNGIRIINDSYNANPGSVRAALNLLTDTGIASDRKIAVLGDMLELGEHSARLHTEIGCYLAGLKIDILLAVGPLSTHVVEGARRGGMKAEAALHFSSKESLGNHLNTILKKGDLVLVKASRGIALEEIASTLSC
jgi:UDP-N-acetylmuramoyl-tripeptide--D-alanyl-D-alanine ligase